MNPQSTDAGNTAIRPWRLQWRPEHVQRFWNWMAEGRIGRANNYFSEQVGEALLRKTARHFPLAGVVLDLGAARGFLVRKLLARGVHVIAVDSSTESVASIAEMGRHQPGFLDARIGGVEAIPAEDESVDVLFLLEVVEHLDDETLGRLLAEMRRVVRPGGHVVITTPNDERLSDGETACPSCGCLFHTMQHVRSWNAALLSGTLASAGFSELACEPTLLSRFRLPGGAMLQRINSRLRGRALPNLFYVGRSAGMHNVA